MKIFWNHQGHGVPSNEPVLVSLEEARRIWCEELSGVEGDFLGLVDGLNRTIQFYVNETVPVELDEANDLEVISIDFPRPEMQGSYSKLIRTGDVLPAITRAFREGADYRKYGDLAFGAWQ